MKVLPELAILSGVLLLGYAVPWTFMRMLMPALRSHSSAAVPNYRGRLVSPVLGIVWLVWAGCAIVAGVLANAERSGSVLVALTLAGPLALVAFALGIVDDVYGAGDTKGFRGHLRALAGGTLTTGGLKLVGIGLASLVVGLILGRIAPWGARLAVGHGVSSYAQLRYVAGSLLAGAAIALTSNFVNLMDLRPGRALKAYSFLAALAAVSAGLLFVVSPARPAGVSLARTVEAAALLAFLWGPVAAVWRYDLGEVGMLGDSGANPMGAVAGMLIVSGLPFWGLAAYAVAMFALNLASERLSFSRVIEGSRFLSWLDGLGRLPAEGGAASTDVTPAVPTQAAETGSHAGPRPE